MKVKSDHRSRFSNLSNWKEEAWKVSGLQQDSNPWPPRHRCDAPPTDPVSWNTGSPINLKVFLFLRTRVFHSHAPSQRICIGFCHQMKNSLRNSINTGIPRNKLFSNRLIMKIYVNLDQRSNENTGFLKLLKLHSDTLLKEPLNETWMPTHGDHNVLVTHRCAETGESICDVWLGTRSKIACMSWNLASLLILNSLDFSLLSSFIWKGKNLSIWMQSKSITEARKTLLSWLSSFPHTILNRVKGYFLKKLRCRVDEEVKD